MKAGDLICYNAAGMREKTMGLVVDVIGQHHHLPHAVVIMWTVIGELMPRKEWDLSTLGRLDRYHAKINPGELCVHQIGDWFEVINESR